MKRRLAFALLAISFVLAGHVSAQERKPDPALKTSAGASSDTGWPYRIVIVPDSQRYTTDRIYKSDPGKKGDTRKGLPTNQRGAIFEQMMQWVADHAEKDNIKLLLHVGYIVENRGNKAQYAMIEKGIAKIYGKVPYVLAVGNHDDARVASEFFPVTRNPLNAKMFGGARTKGMISDL